MADETKNVEISFLKRVESQLNGTTNVDYFNDAHPGFDKKTATEWIEPRSLGYTPTPTRRSQRFELWTFQVLVCTRTGDDSSDAQRETHWRAAELVDAVLAAFGGFDLPVQDWGAMGDPTLFYLRFREASVAPLPAPAGGPQDLAQRVVTLPADLIVTP